jgi:hypothetical protein
MEPRVAEVVRERQCVHARERDRYRRVPWRGLPRCALVDADTGLMRAKQRQPAGRIGHEPSQHQQRQSLFTDR